MPMTYFRLGRYYLEEPRRVRVACRLESIVRFIRIEDTFSGVRDKQQAWKKIPRSNKLSRTGVVPREEILGL